MVFLPEIVNKDHHWSLLLGPFVTKPRGGDDICRQGSQFQVETLCLTDALVAGHRYRGGGNHGTSPPLHHGPWVQWARSPSPVTQPRTTHLMMLHPLSGVTTSRGERVMTCDMSRESPRVWHGDTVWHSVTQCDTVCSLPRQVYYSYIQMYSKWLIVAAAWPTLT